MLIFFTFHIKHVILSQFQVVELAHQNPNRVSVPELLQELQVTKNELENIRVSNNSVKFVNYWNCFSVNNVYEYFALDILTKY